MPETKEQIVWLDTQDAGFRLFIDDQDRLILDELNTPASEDIRQMLIDMGFEQTQSGLEGQYTALMAYGLSRLPGAKLVEMDRQKINAGYREVLLKNTQAFVQEIIDDPATNPEPPESTDEQGINDFLNGLAEGNVAEEPTENEAPELSMGPEDDPVAKLDTSDVAVFTPHDPNLRVDIGMVSETIQNTRNQIGYHVLVAGYRNEVDTLRLWENDYDIQVIDAGFSWDAPGKRKEVVEKENNAQTGIVFQVVVTDTSTLTHTFETIKAEDIGAIIQADQAALDALEAQDSDAGPTENTFLDDETFDDFLNDIPEPRKSRVSKQLLSTDNDTGRPRKAVVEEHVAQGFIIATKEENNRKKRGLSSPDGQFIDGFSKTDLDYAGYLISLAPDTSVAAEDEPTDINVLREKARALGLEKEADALWLNQDVAGLEKLIADNSKPADQNMERPWGDDEQYRILDDTTFRTPLQFGTPTTSTGKRVLLKDYPEFEFVAHPDKGDAVIFSEFKTGMRIVTSYDLSIDAAAQKGLAALKKNTPDPLQLKKIVDDKQINDVPEEIKNYGVIVSDQPAENTPGPDSGYVLADVSFKNIDQITSKDLLALIRMNQTKSLESQGYKATMGDLMAEVSRRMEAGTLLKDLGWPDDPDAVYVNRENGTKRAFMTLGHGYSFFEKFDPESLESRPVENVQDVHQPTFEEQKQEIRREYSDRGYALFFKISDESWNLTHKKNRTVGQTEYLAGDIALSLDKEAFLEVDSCIEQFETFFSEQTSPAKVEEPESVSAHQTPDFSSITEAMYNKRMNLPSNESLWYTIQKSAGQAGPTYKVTIGRHDDSSLAIIYGEGDTVEAAYNRAASRLKPAELNPGQFATEEVSDATPESQSKHAIRPYKEQFGSGAAKNVGKLLNDLGIAQEVVDNEEYYARIENEPYMDLIIEKHFDKLFLTHYFEQNGDLIMDNELVFRINSGYLIFDEVALQNLKGGEKRVYDKGFANMFAKNLLQQGFGQGKVCYTSIAEARRLEEEAAKSEPEDVKKESWQDYDPGQLPYYELGGEPVDVNDIGPADFPVNQDGTMSITNFFPGEAPSDPQVFYEKLMQYRATEEQNLIRYQDRYKEIGEKGIAAISETDRNGLSDDKAVATGLFLEHSHISYSKGYIAAIDKIVQEQGLEGRAADSQKTKTMSIPEKIAHTDKSVRDNFQRAVLKDNEIEILNKSGRKIVNRKTFSLSKWESLSQSFGNPAYNKREFVKSLGIVMTDGSPEAESLKERILDSQVKAIDSVYDELKSIQAQQETVEETPADNFLPDGWLEGPNGGMITNQDPISGGIIDCEIMSGKWFVIPENSRIKRLVGFDTRTDAYNALMSQVAMDFDPTTPENYAKIMSDIELQEEYQDVLDSLFNGRIVDVRNALRDLGWEGMKYKDLFKHGASLNVTPIPTRSGANILGYTINGVKDDLTLTPEQLAKKVDEAHNANFHEDEDKNMIGINQNGIEIHQADNGNRYLLKDGVKTSAPMVLSPDRTMKPYSPEELFEKNRLQFLTSDEIESFRNPKVAQSMGDYPGVDEIPSEKNAFITDAGDINLRRLLLTGGLPEDPEKIIPLIEKKMGHVAKEFESYCQKYEAIRLNSGANSSILNQLKTNVAEAKGRLEALSMAMDEQNQLIDDQQTIKM
jgi:hypothetical protein